jgi:YCII-related domain-containing protein
MAGHVAKEKTTMAEFVFTYRMPQDYVPGGAETRKAWQSWFDGMGRNLIDKGKPVIASAAVGTCDSGARIGGFSVIEAANMEAALEIARACPSVDSGGGVEVGAVLDLTGPR